jgi:hypothetical protein
MPQRLVHFPCEQVCSGEQDTPQLPQLSGSFWMSTQLYWQSACPAGQFRTHSPLSQVRPDGQTHPQPPQLFESDPCVSIQAPLQLVLPRMRHISAGFWAVRTSSLHCPFTHSWLSRHAFPQDPQFFKSLLVLTQAPEHRACPVGQINWCTPTGIFEICTRVFDGAAVVVGTTVAWFGRKQ